MPETESRYSQISESIKLIFDLTSRVDERVKILMEQHAESTQRIEKLIERYESMITRISVLENKNGNGIKEDVKEIGHKVHELSTRVSTLELSNNSHEHKWKVVGDYLFKIIITVLGAVLAWKLSAR